MSAPLLNAPETRMPSKTAILISKQVAKILRISYIPVSRMVIVGLCGREEEWESLDKVRIASVMFVERSLTQRRCCENESVRSTAIRGWHTPY